METLHKIQTKLKAPKGQYNNFGKYAYRSCEDILEALKPLLLEHGATLTITDKPELVGERYYIVATATLHAEGKEVSTQGSAREPQTKKGMDESQITGAASSYARKNALNGLFAIDDNKDADSTNTHDHDTQNNQPRQRSNGKALTDADFGKYLTTWGEQIKSGNRTAADIVEAAKQRGIQLSNNQIEKLRQVAA